MSLLTRPTLLGLSLLIGSVSIAAPGEEQPYSIRHYDISIQPDFATRTISVAGTIAIDNPGLRPEFSFGLSDTYDSVSISSPVSAVSVERGQGWFTATLAVPTREVTLQFALKGRPGTSNGAGRAVLADSSLFLLWSDRFYPIDFDHWSTVTTTVILPPGFTVLAPGLLKNAHPTERGTEFRFETTHPTVCVSVFADSRWITTKRSVNGIHMQTFLYPESQRFAEQIFRTSGEILSFYSGLYGSFPFDGFAFASISGLDARRAFDGFIGYEPAYLEKELTTTGHDAHETALLWWCYTIRGAGSGGFQWTEGFGDYAEMLYGEEFHKPLPKIFSYFRDEYLKLPPEQDVLYGDLKGNTPQKIVHGKYPWLMHVLRFVVGDAPFRRAMKLLFERYRFRTFTMAELVATLEEGCGQSLTWWRDEWLNRKGVPTIAFQWSVRSDAGAYRIHCSVEQRGEVYHLPVEIGIVTSSGTRIEKISLTEQQMTWDFTSDQSPSAVILDPNAWILMKRAKE